MVARQRELEVAWARGARLQQQGRFIDAGLLFQQTLRLTTRARGDDHAAMASAYRHLGDLEHAAGNWLRGEPFTRKALRLRTRALGRRHPLVAGDLSALAALLDRLGRHGESAPLHARALAILQSEPVEDHALMAAVLGNLATGHLLCGRLAEAEPLARRALDAELLAVGPAHPNVGRQWSRLAAVIGRGRRPREAVAMFRRALRILRKTLGPAHPDVGVCLEHYSHVLRRLRSMHASRVAARAAERIRKRIDAVNDAGVALTGTVNPDHAGFDLIVRHSPIHRLGVFTGERIPAHRKVIEYTGERISAAEGNRRWDPARSYLFDLTRNWTLDGAIGGSGAEYINHSCEPNLKARLVKGHILYMSTREIAKEEELTVDYQYAYNTDRMPCTCGAMGCRGVMNLTRQEARARRARRRRRTGR